MKNLEYVCVIDVVGGDNNYKENIDEFIKLYRYVCE